MKGVIHLKDAFPNSEEIFHVLEKLKFPTRDGSEGRSIADTKGDQNDATNLFFYYYPMWLQQYFEKVCSVKTKIITVMINFYDPNQWCDWHEDGLFSVATLSFGYSRKFQFRDMSTGKITGEYKLDSGDLIIFHSSLQEDHQHHIVPLTQKEKDEALRDTKFGGNRISMVYFVTALKGENDRKIVSPDVI